jgi:hypothetical protein
LNPNDEIIQLSQFWFTLCTAYQTTSTYEMHWIFVVSISIYSYLFEKSEQPSIYLVKLHKNKNATNAFGLGFCLKIYFSYMLKLVKV